MSEAISQPASQKVDWRLLTMLNEAARQSPNYLSFAEETRRMFAGLPASTPEILPSVEECVQLVLEEQRLYAASLGEPEAFPSDSGPTPDELYECDPVLRS